jgi:hypothetical protein
MVNLKMSGTECLTYEILESQFQHRKIIGKHIRAVQLASMGEQMVHRVDIARNGRHELNELFAGPIFAVGFFDLVYSIAKYEYLCIRIESNDIGEKEKR